MKDFGRAAACLVLSLSSLSCSLFSGGVKQARFDTQEDVGSVQVAVQSVAPFEDYISSLEPQFELKPQDAFLQAIAQSQIQDTILMNQFLATLEIALPQITKSKTSTVTDNADGQTNESTTTRESQPGDIGTPPVIPTLMNASGSATLLPGTVDIDSALRYRAAAALAQEVALLNRYVRDAAVSTGTKPYIVRLLVTVMPGARNQPYDSYSTISFFTDEKENKEITSEAYRQIAEFNEKNDAKKYADNNTTLESAKNKCGGPVRVIPLLVTDTLESSLHTNALQRIRDIGAALSGTLSSIGLGAAARAHTEELDKTLGKNLNSLFTLGQPAPNAVVARLGAAFSNGNYVTVGRTYGVSVLVLVKTMAADPNYKGDEAWEIIPCPGVQFVANSQMHDAHGAGFVKARKPKVAEKQFVSLLESRHVSITNVNASQLLAYAAADNYEKFKVVLGDDAATAWNDALSIVSASGRSVGKFSVSIPKTLLPGSEDRFSLFDDGNAMKLAINNGLNLQADRLSAAVKAQWTGDKDNWLFLTNDEVKVGGYGTTAVFTFPSLRKIRESNTSLKGDPLHVYAEVKFSNQGSRPWQKLGATREWYPFDKKQACVDGARKARNACDRESDRNKQALCEQALSAMIAGCHVSKNELVENAFVDAAVRRARTDGIIQPYELPIPYFSTAKPTPPAAATAGFTISSPAVVLADAKGAGNLVLEIRSDDRTKPANVHFRVVSGGFISAIQPGTTQKGADYIATDGTFIIAMKNLRPRVPVVIHAFRFEGNTPIPVNNLAVDVVAE